MTIAILTCNMLVMVMQRRSRVVQQNQGGHFKPRGDLVALDPVKAAHRAFGLGLSSFKAASHSGPPGRHPEYCTKDIRPWQQSAE